MKQRSLEQQTVTAAELASVLSLTARRIRDLAADGTVKAVPGKKFLLAESVRGYVRKLRDRKEGPTIAAARRRKLEAEAELSELNLAERKGTMISVDDAARRLSPGMIAVRQLVLSSDLDEDTRGNLLEALRDVFTRCITTPPTGSDDDETTRLDPARV